MKDTVLKFLQEKELKLCVIATATLYGKPESAVMGYAIQADGTIYLSTHTGTRKYNNVKQNQKVALVVGWSFTESNVQIDGIGRLIEEGQEHKEIEEFFFGQNPTARAFYSPDTIFIEVKPVWVRFLDFSTKPSKITEENLS